MALLDIKEVSAWLNLKPTTLYLWVAQGKIPALKLHGLIRFVREDVEQWLENCRGTPRVAAPVPRRAQPRGEIDDLIASVKRDVYTFPHGKPDQDRATRKGEPDGSV
jgi:excisionase family DNA binding protein